MVATREHRQGGSAEQAQMSYRIRLLEDDQSRAVTRSCNVPLTSL